MLVCCFSLAFIGQLKAGMNFSRRMQGVDRKVTELMILAMQARDAGDYANAELFYMYARELKPSLPRPLWLERPQQSMPTPITDESVLDRTVSLPYSQAKILLEEQLRKNPANSALRARFLDLAKKNGDELEVRRHAPLIDARSAHEGKWWRYLFFLLILLLLLWQLWEFVRDFRNRKR
jgi:hypothetical protein